MPTRPEWLPANWDFAGQLDEIQAIPLRLLMAWDTYCNGLAKDLESAKSNEVTDYGSEGPYGDTYAVQNPKGSSVYEDAYPDDFDLDESNKTFFEDMWDTSDDNLFHNASGQFGISEDLDNYPDFPEPKNDKVLQSLWTEICKAVWGAADTNALDDMKNAWAEWDGDPVEGALKMASLLQQQQQRTRQAVSVVKQLMIQWSERQQELSEEAKMDYLNEQQMTNEGGKSLALRIAILCEKAMTAIDEATAASVSDSIAYYAKALRGALKISDSTNELDDSDKTALESQVEDIHEIASRSFHDDIRSWSEKGIQKQDALLTFSKIYSYWKKINTTKTLKSATKNPKHMAGVPSYRFKIGQIVKARNTHRQGKIIGMSIESATGRQVYHVRMLTDDRTKVFYTGELSKA